MTAMADPSGAIKPGSYCRVGLTAAGVSTIGNRLLLSEPLTALFCSARCPGGLILQTYDLARELRDAGVAIIGGFQTPMERECLRLLLRGRQPLVICPARSIAGMRIPASYRLGLAGGRLLIASALPPWARRATADLAARRNELVRSLAARVIVAHAAPGGRTEALARRAVAAGQPLFTLDSPANANLLALGARPLAPGSLGAVNELGA